MANANRFLWREIREIAASISEEGIAAIDIESKGYDGGVRATDFAASERPETFTPSTVILHGGYGIWELKVPQHVLRDLVDVTLRIETIRTHGMLHSPKRNTKAEIFFNDVLVDRIYLVKPHPHGEDFGVDSRRAFPVFRYINKNRSVQQIKIKVDDEVYWDIDGIVLEPIVLRTEITPEAAMVIGALISSLIGGVVSLLMI